MPALESVLYGGVIAEGKEVYEFEAAFAEHFGLRNALGMSSGTAALHVAMLLAGVRPGDEVISTSMTAEPTNTTILHVGAVPIFADVDPFTGNLDSASVEASIGPKTRAICVVHYAGYPASLSELRSIADRHGLVLIEDCAHALGASYRNQPIGTVGDFSIFSFQAIKHMTTVDGGVLTMRDADLLPDARRLRWFGLTKGAVRTDVDISVAGFKYNMNNVAAAIGLKQLNHVDSILQRHISNGTYYDKSFVGISGMMPASLVEGSRPSYWIYTLLADAPDDVQKCLAAAGVASSKLHRPNHLHSVFRDYRRPLPNLESFYKRLIHIPCGWWVSDSDRELIIEALAKG
jgi:dTDP-4-amino-4,6-dideoxygalactose transaminase